MITGYDERCARKSYQAGRVEYTSKNDGYANSCGHEERLDIIEQTEKGDI